MRGYAVFAASAVVVLLSVSAHAGTVFNFSGLSSASWAKSFDGSDGVTDATVTGQVRGNSGWQPAKVTQVLGLGVRSNGLLDMITDGWDRDERLVLNFNKKVRVNSLSFLLADRNDDVLIKYDAHTVFKGLGSGSGLLGHYTLNFAGAGLGLADTFKIAAVDCDDEWQLVYAEVTAVPLPAAVWGGLMLIGGLAAYRWRRGNGA